MVSKALSTEINTVHLTYREISCLRLSALDYRCYDIAKRLHLSEKTVRKHLEHCRKKLNCVTIQGAVYKAIRIGLL